MRDIIKRILLEDKEERFLEFIINDLVNNTKIDYDKGEINHLYFTQIRYTLPTLATLHILPILPIFSFSKYCRNTYGLTKQEIDYVWEKYRNIIIDKIINRENINESNNKKERFIQYVINELVNETNIYHDKGVVCTPYNLNHTLLYYKIKLRYPSLSSEFYDYCKDIYGLTDQEIDYVWEEYKSTIKDKITNK